MSLPVSAKPPTTDGITPLGAMGMPNGHRLRLPRTVRKTSRLLRWMLPCLALIFVGMPWQQSALGTGQVIAYAPEQRVQALEAPLGGVIAEWHVTEGEVVEEGQPLVTLRDNAPDYLDTLLATEDAARTAQEASESAITSLEAQRDAAERAAARVRAEYDAKVASLRQKLVGYDADAEVQSLQADRTTALAAEGVRSTRSAELAVLKRDKAVAAAAAMRAEVRAVQAAGEKASAEADAKARAAQAKVDEAVGKAQSARQKLLKAQADAGRQQAQTLVAPRDGAVLRLYGGPGGSQVKQGTSLITLVPEADARAVELWIDGNDMPLVREGEDVRLIFEGWPALQAVGFPGADAGTYSGIVDTIDATGDDKGRFRVRVTPDPDAHDWPSPRQLLQGVRAKGFVLLGQVPLGYEIWRRVNGFPSLPPEVVKGKTSPPPNAKKPRSPSSLK